MLYHIDNIYNIIYNKYMETYNIKPSFDSNLVSIIFKLESIRDRFVFSDTPPWLFYDLKETLHVLESLNSARIEGNHTTLAEIINKSTNIQPTTKLSEKIVEIINIKKAMSYINDTFSEGDIVTKKLIKEIHAIVVDGLIQDGSKSPGSFRTGNVSIKNSKCVVSSPQFVPGDIDELLEYINAEHQKQEDIIRIACAHHRFTQIHPFDNGNGRTARLLTYIMLVKYGFLKRKKTLLNPSAIFYSDRQKYYGMLTKADSGESSDIEIWCEYFAKGILSELEKMFKLLNREFAVKNIIIPAIKDAYKNQNLDEREYKILMIAVEKNLIQVADIAALFGATRSDKVKCSRFLARMVDKELLIRPPKNPKKYAIRFFNRNLLPHVMNAMILNGLVSDILV